MRDRVVIEREMFEAREDLELGLAELKHLLRERLDVKARARVAVARSRQRARDVLARGREGTQALVRRGRSGAVELYGRARQHPALVAVIAGAVVALGVLYIGRRRAWW